MDLKSLSHSIISLLVVLSLLVPSVAPFLECDNDVFISIEKSDEESKKEDKKELEKVLFQEISNNHNLEEFLSSNSIHHYQESPLQVDQEITSPPPEHIS